MRGGEGQGYLPFPGRLNEGRRPLKNIGTNGTDTHTTHGHCDLETESASGPIQCTLFSLPRLFIEPNHFFPSETARASAVQSSGNPSFCVN